MINHKDENPANNHVENLEWCDAKYNSNYGTCTARKTQTRIKRYSRRIVGTNVETGEHIEFDYVTMAKLMGFSSCHISSCLTGNRKTHGGYTWEYADSPDDGSGKHYLAKPGDGDNDDLGGV
jgi:hypothetical protein